MRVSQRAHGMEPFYVMEMAKAARALAQASASSARPVVFLNIGEPDFTAPPLVQEAAQRALRDGRTQYTPAAGLPELRERISQWYAQRFGVAVNSNRIIVTAGASAALQLACLALIEAGDEVLMPDPSYPCNRHFVRAAEGRAVLLPSGAQERFQLSHAAVQAAWNPGKPDHTCGQIWRTRGVLLASPSNPTGTSIDADELSRIHAYVQAQGGVTLMDEIYLGLSYDGAFAQTALALDENVISINSFSKYFNMTGWRLGWLVVPESLVQTMERLSQHLFICPSALAQHAALACFEAESLAEYERRRAEFKARRDYFVPALNALGLHVPVLPDGAFYAWADCSALCAKKGIADSWDFAWQLLRQAHVAVTPGRDFGTAHTAQFVRLSMANSLPQLHTAVARLQEWLA